MAETSSGLTDAIWKWWFIDFDKLYLIRVQKYSRNLNIPIKNSKKDLLI
jgi:hypothetical protein